MYCEQHCVDFSINSMSKGGKGNNFGSHRLILCLWQKNVLMRQTAFFIFKRRVLAVLWYFRLTNYLAKYSANLLKAKILTVFNGFHIAFSALINLNNCLNCFHVRNIKWLLDHTTQLEDMRNMSRIQAMIGHFLMAKIDSGQVSGWQSAALLQLYTLV